MNLAGAHDVVTPAAAAPGRPTDGTPGLAVSLDAPLLADDVFPAEDGRLWGGPVELTRSAAAAGAPRGGTETGSERESARRLFNAIAGWRARKATRSRLLEILTEGPGRDLGKVLCARLAAHPPVDDLDELLEIPGIGPVRLALLTERLAAARAEDVLLGLSAG